MLFLLFSITLLYYGFLLGFPIRFPYWSSLLGFSKPSAQDDGSWCLKWDQGSVGDPCSPDPNGI